jgi:phospholipid/cholesterol/gamma-HCH transport system substrate-binding protein
MENKAHAMAAGIFVVALTAVLVVLAAWLTRDTGERDIYEISTRETVTGLQAQAPVRYRGVDVGKVSWLGFDPKVQGNVLMRLEVDSTAPVTSETFATLSFQGVTGLAFVQLDDSGKPAPRIRTDEDNPARIPLRPGFLAKLSDRSEVILDRVEQISGRINNLLGEPNQQRLAVAMENIGRAAASIDRLSTTVTAIFDAQLGPEKVNIPAFVRDADSAVNSLKATSDEARAAVREIGVTARRLNEKDGPIDRLAEGTQALSHAADSFNAATLPRINRVTEDTSRAVRNLSRTVNGINDNPQSLIFGSGEIDPGPGEPGFSAPGAKR